jgi:hypothetical protein
MNDSSQTRSAPRITTSVPRAITMWDFSWLERRWPGAGYEDWDKALDELVERGYDAVRIDAFPHLVATDPLREWELRPHWNQQDWGSPALNRVRVQPALNEFIAKCAARNIKVALSTWFREDHENLRLRIIDGRAHGALWRRTLDTIAAAGLLEQIWFVDLCNEWALDLWAPFYTGSNDWSAPGSLAWMDDAIATVHEAYPQMPCTFSYCFKHAALAAARPARWSLAEPHVWLTQGSGFYKRIGYTFQRFTTDGFESLARHGEALYRTDPSHWQTFLRRHVAAVAQTSRDAGLPLVTTECWGMVDYKDWPLLDWGWVKELCEIGLDAAITEGRWIGLATSNFCGPQFRGMWRDIEWHQRLTHRIKSAHIEADLLPS